MQGGWAMWPLGICSLFMLFLIFYCWRETVRGRFVPDAVLGNVHEKLRQQDLKGATNTLQEGPSVLSRAMTAGLSKVRLHRSGANREKVETVLIENLESEENETAQWINYLNVTAAGAPMIGLLGTVSGMIGAFQTISEGGMGKPELLAGDIGEALITTATGLVIGIPAMIAYFIMRNRLSRQMLATAQSASDLLDSLTEPLEEEAAQGNTRG
jgi:biopolymer transport protein ExbB